MRVVVEANTLHAAAEAGAQAERPASRGAAGCMLCLPSAAVEVVALHGGGRAERLLREDVWG